MSTEHRLNRETRETKKEEGCVRNKEGMGRYIRPVEVGSEDEISDAGLTQQQQPKQEERSQIKVRDKTRRLSLHHHDHRL